MMANHRFRSARFKVVPYDTIIAMHQLDRLDWLFDSNNIPDIAQCVHQAINKARNEASMFKIKAIDTITWPVEVSIPQDGGKIVKAEFIATFRYLTDTEVEALLVRSRGNNRAMLKEVVTGWDGVTDADDMPLPFTPDNLDGLLGHAYVSNAMVVAWGNMQRGAAAKN